jgi:DNA repair exonuclease SbcCD nuclease subunit
MPKFLCIGDIHIKTKNFPDVNILLKEIEKHLQEMKENPYDLIVVMGDTLDTHRRLDSECLSKATEYFLILEKYSPVYIITGNHDLVNNSQYLTDKHWLNPFKSTKHRFVVIDTVVDANIDGFRIIAIPYVPDGFFHKALCEKLGDDYYTNNKPSIIFGHQMFNGTSMGGIDSFKDAEDWNYDIQVITGHVHDKQTIPIPKSKKTIYYTGSSLQHAFGEKHDKTIASVYLSKDENGEDEIKIEEIKLDLPIRKIVYCDISEIEKKLSKLEYEKIESGMLKIKMSIKGPSEDYKSFIKTKLYREHEKKGIKFDFKGEFKDELYKHLTKFEKKEKSLNSNIEFQEMKHVDFFHLLDLNIKKDKELLNLHERIKKKLPIRCVKVKDEEEIEDDVLII